MTNPSDTVKTETDQQKMFSLPTQEEAAYSPAGGAQNRACSNCRFFLNWENPPQCHLIQNYPEPIAPNGVCNRHEVKQDVVDTTNPLPVVIVDTVIIEEAALKPHKSVVETLKELARKVIKPDEPAFSVFKSSSGKKFWIARHTGKFVDREGEILSDKSHEEYVERVQKGLVPMPELWTWHTKGTRHGEAIMVWKSGGFTLALGTFDETTEAEHAYRFYEKNSGKIKLSHMFKYPKHAKQNGVYHAYNTIEITTLPDGAEAFPYTSFEEITPMFTEEQQAFIRSVGGDEMLKRAESADNKALADTAKLEAAGVQSKSMDNFTGASIPANPDVNALKAVQGDIESRLKKVEETPQTLTGLKELFDSLKQQVDQLTTSNSTLAAKNTDLEKKLLEYTAVAPPASKSNDSIVSAAEKSLVENLAAAAKAETQKSLVESMTGSQPAVSA